MPSNDSANSPVKGIYALIDTTYVSPADIMTTADKLISGGAGIIQLRAKGMSAKHMLEAACGLRDACASGNATLIINDRVDIALACGAGGVHLGQDDLPVAEARKLLGGRAVIGLSTHNPAEAAQASLLGADYVSFGPVFATKTKKDAQSPKGIEGLREARACTTLPIVAIGGITEETLPAVLEAGADAAAIVSDILLARDITAKAASLISLAARCAEKRR